MTIEELKEAFSYDPSSGKFKWKIQRGRLFPGDEAGTINKHGYRVINYKKNMIYGHRLAWALMTGEWPKDQIDHKNNIPADNRWENLRESDQTQNIANALRGWTHTNPHKGVSWSKVVCKWHSYIQVKKRRIHLGYFDNMEDAVETYKKAALQHFGEFARF